VEFEYHRGTSLVKRVCLIVEGGGNSKAEKSRLSEAFTKLLKSAGFVGRMPHIIAAGGRDQAFQDFLATLSGRQRMGFPILLVDSEDPVSSSDSSMHSKSCIEHLSGREKSWAFPKEAENSQIALMATCMETWIIADREALKLVFGSKLNENALPPLTILEQRNRQDLLKALQTSTKDCGKDREYRKGETSFKVLAMVNPNTLQQHLPHFRRFLEILNHHLS
jgi:hypothetical protein